MSMAMSIHFATALLLGLLSPCAALHGPALAGLASRVTPQSLLLRGPALAGLASRVTPQSPLLCGRARRAARCASVAYDGEKYSREVRIKEELASPFRGFRFCAYAGMLMGGGASFYIALTGLAASLAGRAGPVERDQLVVNCLVDFGAFALGGGLLWLDLKSRTEKLDKFAVRVEEQTKARLGKDDEADIFIR
jgi:hypothetical protein